jgi:hypothetical protein
MDLLQKESERPDKQPLQSLESTSSGEVAVTFGKSYSLMGICNFGISASDLRTVNNRLHEKINAKRPYKKYLEFCIKGLEGPLSSRKYILAKHSCHQRQIDCGNRVHHSDSYLQELG